MFPSRYWREIPQRYRMEAGKCKKCGYIGYPPRIVCPVCGAREFDTVILANEGELMTYTIISIPPSPFADLGPYAIGIVKLDDGVQITAQLADVDLEKIKTGERYKIEFRKIQSDGHSGIHAYGYKFVPVR
ncbi:MAG: Zn-ribbon domain-containing OB-fold protein [candidate division Zixibacteria bacterium]|nr:Zn-ribbon domain-containing OB-fold protein [candidate division Zixibacteria bacterium]